MSKDRLWPLAQARAIAERIESALMPFADMIAIAGSIRRGRSHVHDIDMVILPKPMQRPIMMARCQRAATILQAGDSTWAMRLQNGLRVDLFFARHPEQSLLDRTPGNWGTVLVCKTGSREHNVILATRARELGMQWKPLEGVVTAQGKVIAGETEESLYKALQIEYVPPGLREVPV